jgi:glycosyltransferase involved in cell wall biosynthesis
MPKRVLAVGHDAYRAGSQIVFLHILRWLRQHHDADMSLVLGAGGALVDDYAQVLPTEVIDSTTEGGGSKIVRFPALSRLRRDQAITRVGRRLARDGVDLVYVNSAAAAPLAVALATRLECPALCHVHELEMSIRRAPGLERMREAATVLDGYVAVSRAVQRNLVELLDIDEARIDLVPGCIPLPSGHRTDRGARVRAELGIPSDAFVVGGCGTLDWRKGADVFLLIAKAVTRAPTERPVHFVWVGGDPRHFPPLEHDLARLGLDSSVHFVGVQPEPAPYFECFDTFLLSSREDPFPLVCLEAAALGVPIVCFADAGGMPEFVEDDAGAVVSYLDVDAAASRIVSFMGDAALTARLGRAAATKVAARCSVDIVGPQLASVLDRYVS